MSLTGSYQLTITAREADSLDLMQLVGTLSKSYSKSWTDGAGAGKIQVIFSDTRSLAGSATEDLDLAGALINAIGKTITFTKIKGIFIHAAAANNAANNVNVTRPASNGALGFLAAGDGVALKPDGLFAYTDPSTGFVVTAGTGDLLTITNSAPTNAVSFDVILVGEGSVA